MKFLITSAVLLSSLVSYASCNLTVLKNGEVSIDKALMGKQSRKINEQRNHTIENRWLAVENFDGIKIQVNHDTDSYMDQNGSTDTTVKLLVDIDGEISMSSANTRRKSSLEVSKVLEEVQYDIKLECN